jgi:hypothetical protein
MQKFKNQDGTCTAYSFVCGYVEKYGTTDYPRATLSREPNGYHVKGFTADETHFWEIFPLVKDARRYARQQAGKLKAPTL